MTERKKMDDVPAYCAEAGQGRTQEMFIISLAGSQLEAREKRIAGAIYRSNIDWTNAKYKGSRKPLEFAARNEGGDELLLRHRVGDKLLHLHFTIKNKFLDDQEFEYQLEEVTRTDTDTLKEMMEAQDVRLKESDQLIQRLMEEKQVMMKAQEVRMQETERLIQRQEALVKAQDARQQASDRLNQQLKEEKEAPPVFLSISSQTACGNQQIVQWNGAEPKVVPAAHFTLSPDNRTVTVLQKGVYQVHVRLGGTNSGNQQHLGLQINGADVAICLQSDANGHQNTTQILEIMPLEARAVVSVRCGCNSNSLGTALATRLIILKL